MSRSPSIRGLRTTLCIIFSITSLLLPLTAAVDPCKKQRNKSFTSQVQVEFAMAHDKGLTPSEISNLQESFVSAYNNRAVVNENNNINCDMKYLRWIEFCEVEASDAYFLFENGNNVYRRVFTYLCTAWCKDCGPDMNLLDQHRSGGRSLQQGDQDGFEPSELRPELEPEEEARSLFEIPPSAGGACKCHRNADIRGPSQREMVQSLGTEVDKMQQANQLKAVKSVLHVWQMEKVSCSTESNSFETSVRISLDTIPKFVDLFALGKGFLDSYNEGAANFCDPYHRRITGVVIRPVSSGRRTRGERRLAATQWNAIVTGSCRGCKENSELFNDSRRRLSRLGAKEEEEAQQEQRELSWTDTCYCPMFPIGKRQMKRGEFEPNYSRSIAETNYVGVSRVREGRP